jgi:hypothetical protein
MIIGGKTALVIHDFRIWVIDLGNLCFQAWMEKHHE